MTRTTALQVRTGRAQIPDDRRRERTHRRVHAPARLAQRQTDPLLQLDLRRHLARPADGAARAGQTEAQLRGRRDDGDLQDPAVLRHDRAVPAEDHACRRARATCRAHGADVGTGAGRQPAAGERLARQPRRQLHRPADADGADDARQRHAVQVPLPDGSRHLLGDADRDAGRAETAGQTEERRRRSRDRSARSAGRAKRLSRRPGSRRRSSGSPARRRPGWRLRRRRRAAAAGRRGGAAAGVGARVVAAGVAGRVDAPPVVAARVDVAPPVSRAVASVVASSWSCVVDVGRRCSAASRRCRRSAAARRASRPTASRSPPHAATPSGEQQPDREGRDEQQGVRATRHGSGEASGRGRSAPCGDRSSGSR